MLQSLIRVAEDERESQYSIRELFAGISDDVLVGAIGGEFTSTALQCGGKRSRAICQAIQERRIHYRAYAFAARFIAGIGSLPEREQQDTRALMWRRLIKRLSTDSGCREMARKIHEKAVELADAIPDLADTTTALEEEEILVDLPINRVVVRGGDMLTRTDRGHIGTPNLFWVRLFFVGGRISLYGGEAGGNRNPSRRGEGAAEGTGDRWYLCRQRRLGVFRWYSRAWWKVSVRINAPTARGGLRTVATAAKCHRGPGRLPSGRGPNADRPFNELATSTARRIAAATWIMSSTTVASRAYAVVPAKRSRWSRGGAYRPRSAPAAGSARHRADAGRRDRAARSPDPQPASCRRSFRRGYRARAAPSTRHHWRPRPDRQPVPGCVGRDVLAGACVPTSGPAGAVPVRVRSRSSAGLRWRRGRLWHPRRQHRPLHTGPGSGDRCGGRRFAPLARRIYVPGILSSQPSQVCPPAHGTVPERRANVQKRARPRGTDRRCSAPFRGSAGRRKDAGTRWFGCCPPEMSTGETHPRAKRPMNRAKTPLRRRAAPISFSIPNAGRKRTNTKSNVGSYSRPATGYLW